MTSDQFAPALGTPLHVRRGDDRGVGRGHVDDELAAVARGEVVVEPGSGVTVGPEEVAVSGSPRHGVVRRPVRRRRLPDPVRRHDLPPAEDASVEEQPPEPNQGPSLQADAVAAVVVAARIRGPVAHQGVERAEELLLREVAGAPAGRLREHRGDDVARAGVVVPVAAGLVVQRPVEDPAQRIGSADERGVVLLHGVQLAPGQARRHRQQLPQRDRPLCGLESRQDRVEDLANRLIEAAQVAPLECDPDEHGHHRLGDRSHVEEGARARRR